MHALSLRDALLLLHILSLNKARKLNENILRVEEQSQGQIKNELLSSFGLLPSPINRHCERSEAISLLTKRLALIFQAFEMTSSKKFLNYSSRIYKRVDIFVI